MKKARGETSANAANEKAREEEQSSETDGETDETPSERSGRGETNGLQPMPMPMPLHAVCPPKPQQSARQARARVSTGGCEPVGRLREKPDRAKERPDRARERPDRGCEER